MRHGTIYAISMTNIATIAAKLIRNRQMKDIMFDWVTQNLMNGRGVNRLDNTQR